MFRCKFHGFPSVARLSDHLEVRLLIEQKTQARTNDGVIVSEQNPNLWHA